MHTTTPSPSFFEGLPEDELARILGRLERRRFPTGAILIGEGEPVEEMYIVEDGLAEVLIADRHGAEHLLSRIGAGGTLGEKARFTGHPAPATGRRASDVDGMGL